ncbi:MAG: site-2 protease family protein [Clostridia bacterium]|nr:site-2 protease family protein [Clostridia bacterium]
MLTAIWAILIFCSLIFIHEFGHFTLAKLSSMTVHEFSIGMGPKIFGFKTKNTEYSLRIFPIGGYVKLEGEEGNSTDPDAFCNKSALKRFAVLFAGAFMNILLGFVIFMIIFSSVGSVTTNRVGAVMDNSAFFDARIKKDDVIVKMEGEKFSSRIYSYADISSFVMINGSDEAKITFKRGDKEFIKVISPKYMESEERTLFGFTPMNEQITIKNIFYHSFHRCFYVIKTVILSLWWLIAGIVPASDMSGPVGIVKEIGNAAKYGWQNVLSLAGLISVNLGVMNLLPIPALDGGRILFLLIEKIRGKKMNPEREGLINFIFFAILILLMITITFGDIIKLF